MSSPKRTELYTFYVNILTLLSQCFKIKRKGCGNPNDGYDLIGPRFLWNTAMSNSIDNVNRGENCKQRMVTSNYFSFENVVPQVQQN